eukprot:TRINITY_DN348_c1_g1_i1.p1 TRINITY_DN348_c1_g1~~TRINITY_DN348_c1_g1_i1.p1  ORF type:complete len:683 (+),score=135.88 TRINITY_DN348_c1_g1_i1:271-2319(+)
MSTRKISLLAQIARTRLNVTVLSVKFSDELERKVDGLVVQIAVGKHKKKTHPYTPENYEDLTKHRWDESFVIDILEGCVAMKLRLREKSFLLGDHVIGSAVVLLAGLPTKSKEDRWFELKKKNEGKVVAEVQLRVQLVPNETLMKISEGVPSTTSTSGSGEYIPIPKTKSIPEVGADKIEGADSKSTIDLPSIGASLSPTSSLTLPNDKEKEKEKEKEPATLKQYKFKSDEGSKSGSFNIFRGIQDKRKQKKNNLYRLLFNLPETETLLFDVVASYVKRGNPLLIDGRLYVSQKYICFFSNIFGIKTTEVIALDEVVSIDQNADGLNAGVAITTKSNSYYFALTFGSSKAKVYEHLMSVWKREAISDTDRSPEMDNTGTGEEEEEEDDEYLSSATFGEETGFLSAEKMTQLINEDLPISVPRFRKMFFSDEPASFQFVQTYHERRGDTEFKMEKWSNHPRFGTFRELQYRSPVNAPIGPKTTINAETQRYSLQKDHLIVETISVLRDIPYGDCFRVEGKWDVTATGKHQCRVVLKVGVYFLKRVLFRGTIENQTMKESAESYKIWLNLAKEEIKRLHPSREPSDPKLSQTKSPQASPATSVSNVHESISPPKTPPVVSSPIEPQTLLATETKALSASRIESSSLTMYFVTLGVLIFWVLILSWKVLQLSSRLSALESELGRP